jgi:hypothetical protein
VPYFCSQFSCPFSFEVHLILLSQFNSFFSRDAHYARYGAVPPSTSEGNRFIRDPDL